MWLFTKTGFYSVVRKPGDRNRLTIRARARRDLVALKKDYLAGLSKIVETDDSDYRFRAHATPTQLAQAMSKIAHDIDYPNFKDEVHRTQGPKRAAIYHRVWSVLFELQPPLRKSDCRRIWKEFYDDLRSQRL